MLVTKDMEPKYYKVIRLVDRLPFDIEKYTNIGDVLVLVKELKDWRGWAVFRNLTQHPKSRTCIGVKYSRLKRISEEHAMVELDT